MLLLYVGKQAYFRMFNGRGEAETENIREWSKGEVLEWPQFDQSERGIKGDNEESSADDNNIM